MYELVAEVGCGGGTAGEAPYGVVVGSPKPSCGGSYGGFDAAPYLAAYTHYGSA